MPSLSKVLLLPHPNPPLWKFQISLLLIKIYPTTRPLGISCDCPRWEGVISGTTDMQRDYCATHCSISAIKVRLHNKNYGHHKTNCNLELTSILKIGVPYNAIQKYQKLCQLQVQSNLYLAVTLRNEQIDRLSEVDRF